MSYKERFGGDSSNNKTSDSKTSSIFYGGDSTPTSSNSNNKTSDSKTSSIFYGGDSTPTSSKSSSSSSSSSSSKSSSSSDNKTSSVFYGGDSTPASSSEKVITKVKTPSIERTESTSNKNYSSNIDNSKDYYVNPYYAPDTTSPTNIIKPNINVKTERVKGTLVTGTKNLNMEQRFNQNFGFLKEDLEDKNTPFIVKESGLALLGGVKSVKDTASFGFQFLKNPVLTSGNILVGTGKEVATFFKTGNSNLGAKFGNVLKTESPSYIAGYGATDFFIGTKFASGVEKVSNAVKKLNPSYIPVVKDTIKISDDLDIKVVGGLSDTAESLKKQAQLSGQNVQGVSASTGFFGADDTYKIVDKPLPTPNSPILERTFFADPKGNLRSSRLNLGVKESGASSSLSFSDKMINLLTDDITFKKQNRQALVFPDTPVEKFPSSLSDVEKALKTGNTLTSSQRKRLIDFQLTQTGQFKPIGFISKESEIIVPPGDIIKREKNTGFTFINNKKVSVIEASVVKGDDFGLVDLNKIKKGSLGGSSYYDDIISVSSGSITSKSVPFLNFLNSDLSSASKNSNSKNIFNSGLLISSSSKNTSNNKTSSIFYGGSSTPTSSSKKTGLPSISSLNSSNSKDKSPYDITLPKTYKSTDSEGFSPYKVTLPKIYKSGGSNSGGSSSGGGSSPKVSSPVDYPSIVPPYTSRGSSYIDRITPIPKIYKGSYIKPPIKSPYVPRYSYSKIRNKNRFVPSYNVFARKGSKFIKINMKGLTRDEALSFGARKIYNTPLATFRIKKTDSLIKSRKNLDSFFTNKKGIFRTSLDPKINKKNTFVEKRKYRISSKGELSGITYKGIKSKSNKNKKLRFI